MKHKFAAACLAAIMTMTGTAVQSFAETDMTDIMLQEPFFLEDPLIVEEWPGYTFHVSLQIVPFTEDNNLTDAEKTQAQTDAFNFMSHVKRIEAEAKDPSGKSHLIDESKYDGNQSVWFYENEQVPEIPEPIYWPSDTRILTDTYWHMQDIADMRIFDDGVSYRWNPNGTCPLYFEVEQLAKPREVRETVTTEDSGGYTVRVKFIADAEDGSEAELLTLELPSIVMFEKQKKEAGWYPYYSYASFVLDLHRLTASEQPALRGFDSNMSGAFYMEELRNESVGSIIYTYNADDFNPGIRWGNINTDGAVDIADAVLLSRYLVSDREAVITSQGLRNSRVVNGASLNNDDVTKILRVIAKKIKAEDLTPEQPVLNIVGNPFGPHTDRNPNAGYED